MTTGEEHGKREVVIRGVGVSPGVAVGTAYPVFTEEARHVERDISMEELPGEISRFEEALIETRRQLREIQKLVKEKAGEDGAGIFDAHLMVVDDPSVVQEVVRELQEKKVNVETVLHDVSERYSRALAEVDDDYLRERAADVKDVARRILRNLAGRSGSTLAELKEPCVVIADDLAPSDTATMSRESVIGFATDIGSRTSHTAIMARALEIPAVVGLHDISIRVRRHTQVLIDGNKGLVVLHPSRERLEYYNRIDASRQRIREQLSLLHDKPAETLDGKRIRLAANIELPGDVAAVKQYAAEGIGLYRTEFLYLGGDTLPNGETQMKSYREVLDSMNPAPVTFRTVDMGGDKFMSHMRGATEKNPFMGWRGIRFCLAQPDIFKTQLRAILVAASGRNACLMYPMISSVKEVIEANRLLEETREELRREGADFNENVAVGAMIEVPGAAITADLIAPHVSFFSLGTNDLIQYALAVDRVNEQVAHLYDPTHPAIIKLIGQTVKAAHDHNLPVSVCGEMAGNPLMTALLLGLGVDEFSANPSSIPLVKRVVRNLTFDQACQLAAEAQASNCSSRVVHSCRELLERVAPEIIEFVE